MRHMEIATGELDVRETRGAEATPAILEYFRDVGRREIASDEVPWCAAFAGSVLVRSGLPRDALPPPDKVLLARSFLTVGRAIDKPRYGALVVLRRDAAGPHAGHVGFVIGSTGAKLMVLGGNQANSVSVEMYRSDEVIGYRWPMPELSAGEIAASGSRTLDRAARAKADAAKGAAAGVSSPVVPALPVPDLQSVASQAGALKGAAEQLIDFAAFLGSRWPLIAAVVGLYYAGRMAWHQYHIRAARVEDQNTGKLVQ